MASKRNLPDNPAALTLLPWTILNVAPWEMYKAMAVFFVVSFAVMAGVAYGLISIIELIRWAVSATFN